MMTRIRPMAVRRKFAAVAVALLAGGGVVGAAEPAVDMRTVLERLDKLEQRNAELEKKQQEQESALSQDRISENEPELTARLKALESQTLGLREQARTVEALEGITAGFGVTMVGQHASNSSTTTVENSQLNYRTDVTVSLPAGEIGNASGHVFAQFRMGQGQGLADALPTFTAANATTFQRPDSSASDSTALLAQAWYQADIPLPLGGFAPQSRQHLEFNLGKMDPFVFFDQNAAADDETRAFLNSAFVHNPLLDAGGDIGVDQFGFTPGMRLAYINERSKPLTYGTSLGVFGAGRGAEFQDSLDSPLVILQMETQQRFFSGLAGNYRLYAWHNGRGADFNGTERTHSGFGLSIDQRFGDAMTVFGRYGRQIQGSVKFDQAVTLGASVGGTYWDRSADELGLAVARLAVSDAFREQAPLLPEFAYQANGAEGVAEIFYRYRLTDKLEITPDVQYVRRPGGDAAKGNLGIVQVRAQLNF